MPSSHQRLVNSVTMLRGGRAQRDRRRLRSRRGACTGSRRSTRARWRGPGAARAGRGAARRRQSRPAPRRPPARGGGPPPRRARRPGRRRRRADHRQQAAGAHAAARADGQHGGALEVDGQRARLPARPRDGRVGVVEEVGRAATGARVVGARGQRVGQRGVGVDARRRRPSAAARAVARPGPPRAHDELAGRRRAVERAARADPHRGAQRRGRTAPRRRSPRSGRPGPCSGSSAAAVGGRARVAPQAAGVVEHPAARRRSAWASASARPGSPGSRARSANGAVGRR